MQLTAKQRATLGKGAESQVQAYFEELSTFAKHVFMRIPDARAGSLTAKPSDFFLLSEGTLFLVEVKETAHNNRLPFANFNTGQAGQMRRWGMAKAVPVVLIRHSKTNLWRVAHLDRFRSRPEGQGSWELSDLPQYHLPSAVSVLLTIRNPDTAVPC